MTKCFILNKKKVKHPMLCQVNHVFKFVKEKMQMQHSGQMQGTADFSLMYNLYFIALKLEEIM